MKKLEIGKNAMYCNAEAVRNYPEVLRGLPFCNWKLEKDSHGRLTKVPYNPKTGFHASVDKSASIFPGRSDVLTLTTVSGKTDR